MSKFIIGITGVKGSGKDTVGKIIEQIIDCEHISFAKKIKDICADLLDIPRTYFDDQTKKELILDRLNGKSLRQLMQDTGELFREYDEGVWIKYALNHAFSDILMITDVRHPNEADYCDVVIKVKRKGLTANEFSNHISETAVDDIVPTFVIDNNSSLENLEKRVKGFVYSELLPLIQAGR